MTPETIAELRRRHAAATPFALRFLSGGPGGEPFIALACEDGSTPLPEPAFDAVLLFAELAAAELPALLDVAAERDALAARLEGAEAVIEVQDVHARLVIAERDEAMRALGKLTAERDAEPDRIAELTAERDALLSIVDDARHALAADGPKLEPARQVLARALPQLAAWQDRKRRDRDITPPHVIAHRGAQLDAVTAERDALRAERDALAAERDALRAMLSGRCLSDITHRDEEHRQSFCMLPAEHAPLAHDDCMGCTWTDAEHWGPSAVDRVADEVARIADESQHDDWASPRARSIVGRRALDGEDQP